MSWSGAGVVAHWWIDSGWDLDCFILMPKKTYFGAGRNIIVETGITKRLPSNNISIQ
jgi:hypothetical protein